MSKSNICALIKNKIIICIDDNNTVWNVIRRKSRLPPWFWQGWLWIRYRRQRRWLWWWVHYWLIHRRKKSLALTRLILITFACIKSNDGRHRQRTLSPPIIIPTTMTPTITMDDEKKWQQRWLLRPWFAIDSFARGTNTWSSLIFASDGYFTTKNIINVWFEFYVALALYCYLNCTNWADAFCTLRRFLRFEPKKIRIFSYITIVSIIDYRWPHNTKYNSKTLKYTI